MSVAPGTSEGRPRNESGAHWGLLGTALWAGAILALQFAVQAATVLLSVVLGRPKLSEDEFARLIEAAISNGWVVSIAALVSMPLVCGAIVAAIKLKTGATLTSNLGLEPFALRSLAGWIAALAVFIVASELLGRALGRPAANEFMARVFATAQPVWLLWLALIVVAPLVEESLFRGFLLKGLASSAIGPAAAVVVTALVWAGIHLQYDLYDMAGIFVFGLMLGAARLQSGSLWVPLILHALMNLVQTVGMTLEMQ